MAKINFITDSDTINVETVTCITKNDIEYSPKFTTEGLDIPITISKVEDSNDPYMVIYQRIPKNVLKNMIKEYLPEILSEITPNWNNL